MSNRRKIKHDPDRRSAVCVAFVHTDEVDFNFFFSFWQLLARDLAGDGKVWRGGYSITYGGTGDLAAARNGAVKAFLADNKADWLWFVDTDQGFGPDTVDRLLASAHPEDRPVVGAMTFSAMREGEDGAGGFRLLFTPVIMDWVHTDERTGFSVRWDYPKDELTRCDGTGSACVLIHRSVFEQVRDMYLVENPQWANWYSRVINPATKELVGEDLSFCLRVMQRGIPIHVDTSVQTTHAKRLWLAEEDYWRQRALNPPPDPAAEYLRVGYPPEQMAAAMADLPSAPDWTVPRYAIIPTHNRPAKLLSLVVSLGSQCDRIVIVDNASTPPVDEKHLQASVPEHCTVEVIRDEEQPPNLARLWNVMFDRCAELARDENTNVYETLYLTKWDVAVFNDDSVVPAGWYDTVATALREHETAAVAHTGDRPVAKPDLVESYPYARDRRMAPHAFVVRGELGLRADESMRWWCFDDDFNRQAIDKGGVLAVPGPVVVNSQANQSTSGVLAEQAQKDLATFAAKWGTTP